MKTNNDRSENKMNFVLQSRSKVDGTTIIEAGFTTANEALKAYDNLPSTFGYNGVRICRSVPATGELRPWSDWLK